ncbi:universal stress protein [Lentzea flava]|uniref:Universal stress protein n=1 Tax=Lentzea flava TaxID=103732 RepID=A0ABQ2URM4_9PSEU|nr:universal stress protein [Lentzea flava]MCP2197246.1 Nucleotide-binding universal stress protein, UspA family [Lentzea flava]GGU50474.1 universal stress protein [Lentzea flava]
MSEKESRPVVVGVDGSAAAQEALRWAVEDARRRGSRVDAISAWHPDYGIVIGPVPAEIGMRISPEAMRSAQQSVLDRAVEGLEGVEIRRVLVEGDPRTILTDASKDAELLVVGSRGHGPLAEAILGSVSSYCVHHASCPVVVIREPKAEKERPVAEAAAPLTPGPLL